MRIKNCSIALVLVFGLAVAGCEREVELWNQSHEYEGEGYGDATRQTHARQVVNPDAAKPSATDAAVDGEKAILGIWYLLVDLMGLRASHGYSLRIALFAIAKPCVYTYRLNRDSP